MSVTAGDVYKEMGSRDDITLAEISDVMSRHPSLTELYDIVAECYRYLLNKYASHGGRLRVGRYSEDFAELKNSLMERVNYYLNLAHGAKGIVVVDITETPAITRDTF